MLPDTFHADFDASHRRSTENWPETEQKLTGKKSTRNLKEIYRKSIGNRPEIDRKQPKSTRNRPENYKKSIGDQVEDCFWCPQGARQNYHPRSPTREQHKIANMWRCTQLQRHSPSEKTIQKSRRVPPWRIKTKMSKLWRWTRLQRRMLHFIFVNSWARDLGLWAHPPRRGTTTLEQKKEKHVLWIRTRGYFDLWDCIIPSPYRAWGPNQF